MNKAVLGVAVLLGIGLAACYYAAVPGPSKAFAAGVPAPTTQSVPPEVTARAQTADFACGCFWGSESIFRHTPGVLTTEVGFEGGTTANPTYAQVCTHTTGHAETVRVTFDPKQISYQQLLEVFFEHHDPTTVDQQGPDFGDQYRSTVFYHTPEQQKLAEAEKAKRDKSGDYVGPIVTQIVPASTFTRAEEYHQEYFEKQGSDEVCHLGNGKKPGK
jgi:peptide-methionine (S)-S-oxide reductase